MLDFYRRNKTEVDKVLSTIAIVVGIYIFIVYLFGYVAPFVCGFILSLILDPLVVFLDKKLRIPRGFGAFIGTVLVLILLGGLGTYIGLKIWRQGQEFTTSFPAYIANASVALDSLKYQFSNVFELIPPELGVTFDNVTFTLMNSVTSFASSILKDGSLGAFKRIPSAFMGLLLTLISTFFFTKDKYMIRDLFVRKSSRRILKTYNTLKRGFFKAFVGYVKAQLVIMSIIACINIVGLIILDYPYALFIGLIIAFVDALPIFGSGFILWPWILMNVIFGNIRMAVGLLVLYGVNLIMRQMLEPKVLGTQIGLHPLVTLMSIYIGLQIFGPIGFFIGPVIMITIKILNEKEPVR